MGTWESDWIFATADQVSCGPRSCSRGLRPKTRFFPHGRTIGHEPGALDIKEESHSIDEHLHLRIRSGQLAVGTTAFDDLFEARLGQRHVVARFQDYRRI